MVDKVALILIYYAVLENKNLCIVFNSFPSFLCNSCVISALTMLALSEIPTLPN